MFVFINTVKKNMVVEFFGECSVATRSYTFNIKSDTKEFTRKLQLREILENLIL